MSSDELYGDDLDAMLDVEEFSSHKVHKHRKKDSDDWLDDSDGKRKKRRAPRWRDIEDKLAKQSLKKQNSWEYGDYDF